MGWDGAGNINRNNGTFTGSQVWQQDRDAAVKIRADRHDTHDEDLATAIENTVARDGQNAALANLPMGGFRHTNVGNSTARNMYAATGQVQDQAFTYVATVGGTADAITLTPAPAITAYTAGQRFVFLASGANTGAVTVNVSGLGTKAITKLGTTALVAGDIPSAGLIDIMYDGTQFRVLGVVGNVTSFMRTLLDDTTAAEARTTLALPGWETIGTATASNNATIDFTWATAYEMVRVYISNVQPATNDVGMWMRTSTDAGVSYDSGATDYGWTVTKLTTAVVFEAAGNAAELYFVMKAAANAGLGTTTDLKGSFTIDIHQPTDATSRTQVQHSGWYYDAAGVLTSVAGGGTRRANADVDGIRFAMESGNIATGEFLVMGYR